MKSLGELRRTTAGSETLLRCEKCGAKVRVELSRIFFNGVDGRVIAFIGQGAVWSTRHDGEELCCPFHPGMRYFLVKVGR